LENELSEGDVLKLREGIKVVNDVIEFRTGVEADKIRLQHGR